MKRVVIVGMGFAGLRAARALAGHGLEVLVVDRANYHLFQPLLYQVATAGLEQESIAYPIRAMGRRWHGITYRMAEVCSVDLERKTVRLAEGEVDYDYLIVAAGSVTNFFGKRSIERNAYDLKRLDHAVDLRNQILVSFERATRESDPAKRRALLTFLIVGGGPTGVEFAGALAELVRFVLAKDYPELSLDEVTIMLLEGGDSILSGFPAELREYALQRLEEMGVEVRLKTFVDDVEAERVILADGRTIDAHTLFWSAGVRAAPLADTLPVEKCRGGRIHVTPHLTLPGDDAVYVVGDMACLEENGEPLPMVAPVAMQQGQYAGEAILQREKGIDPDPFRYNDRGSMATIGKSAAVATVRGVNFSGLFAWLVWLGLHLFYLIGFRNRLVVLMNWSFYYFLHERQVRLITREGEAGTC